jgi:hypothetical protein
LLKHLSLQVAVVAVLMVVVVELVVIFLLLHRLSLEALPTQLQ